MKKKYVFSIVLTILIIVFTPTVHAQANTDVMDVIFKIAAFLGETPLAQELFLNYLDTENGKDVMAYWEDDVYPHIKEGIKENASYQNKLQYVLGLAYQNGHCKIDFISDNTPPDYYEPSFDDRLYNQPIEFNEGDLFYAIHGLNGHLVIDATYLGDNQFEVWVALQDHYDFNFDMNCNYGIICAVSDYLHLQKKIYNIGHEFYTTIGFTYTCAWEPDMTSSENVTGSESQNTDKIDNNSQISSSFDIPYYVTNQYYSRGLYDIGYYTGEWNGKPNGNGTLNYDSGTKYTIKMPDGEVYYATTYTGNWLNGKKYGSGIFTYSNGIQYDGIWNTDGYYFKGYIIYPTYKQYIEQIADGDEINIVRSEAPIYNDSIDYKNKQSAQDESDIEYIEGTIDEPL